MFDCLRKDVDKADFFIGVQCCLLSRITQKQVLLNECKIRTSAMRVIQHGTHIRKGRSKKESKTKKMGMILIGVSVSGCG